MTTTVFPSLIAVDIVHGGPYSINGTVSRLGVVGKYKVRCYHHHTGKLIKETWSDTNGAYLFTGLKYLANGYFSVAFDNNATPLNAAISDLITPEPMP